MSSEEFKQLRRFTQSDFFNTDGNLIQLINALTKYYPKFEGRGMDREVLYEKVFSGQAYNDAKWRNLIFKMNKLTEEYLIWIELQKADTIRQKLLTTAYGNRNLYKRFEKCATELSEKLAIQSKQSADALRERMQTNLLFYHHPQTAKVDNLDKLQSAMDDLDNYYFAEKLRLACDLKIAENMVVGATPIRMVNEVSKIVQQRAEFRDLDYLKIYDKIYDLLTQQPTMEAFQSAFDFYISLEQGFSKDDRQFGLLHLLNFAINQTNKGELAFRPQLMKLYKLGLTQGALFTTGNLSDSTFLNIVSTASGLKEFDWAKQFILDYEKYLPVEVKQETTTLSFVYFYFHKKQYTQVVDLLINFSFQNFVKLLSSKHILLRCYFELSLIDSSYYIVFTSFAKAFDKFVKREKQLSLTRKLWYKNLILQMLNLAKHKYENTWNKTVKAKILEEVSIKPMYLKAWLFERIKDL